MIYIVHGDDYAKSRKLIVNQKDKVAAEHIIEHDIEEITPKELYEAIVSFDLFGKAPFVVLKIPTTNIPDTEQYLQTIEKTPEESVLVLLCSKKLSRTNSFLKNAKDLKAKVALNEKTVESNVFNFVDQLFYKNRQGTYRELEKLESEDSDPFYIFSMILYGIRNIAHAKFDTQSFEKKSAFVRDKTKRQAESFTESDVKMLFEYLYETDKKLKTGLIDKELVIPVTIEKILNA